MRRVPGDKHTSIRISVGKAQSQVPESDIAEINIHFRPDGTIQKGAKIEIRLPCRSTRPRNCQYPFISGPMAL